MLLSENRGILLDVALSSILHGLSQGRPLMPDLSMYAPELCSIRAVFVTLNRNNRLRGCIGHLEATQPLVVDVAENAFAAAFRDPRFNPLQKHELKDLELHISILSPLEPINFSSEQDLLRQLRPGIDGLILEGSGYRGTFLPSVWEHLADPEEFLDHLKCKAGMPPGYSLLKARVFRYGTESFSS